MPAASSRQGAPDTPEEFTAWVEPLVSDMARLASRLAPGAERDDVVQEALIRAWHKRHQFDTNRGTPAAWLLAITADSARKAARRRRPSWRLVDTAARSSPPDTQIDVDDAVAKLPGRQRLAVECFYFVGLSVADTAAVMRCSEGTVKSTLFDARARLRKALEAPS